MRRHRVLNCTRFVENCTCCGLLRGFNPIILIKSRPVGAGRSPTCCGGRETACSRSMSCVYGRLRVTTGCVPLQIAMSRFKHPAHKTTCTLVTHLQLRRTDPLFGKKDTTGAAFKN